MSKFTKHVPFDIDFEGDHVTMRLKRLSRRTFMDLNPIMKDMPKMKPDEKLSDEQMAKMTEISDKLISILPDNVVEFYGLRDDSGEQVTINEVAEEFYFFGLASTIAWKLISISSVSSGEMADAKKPEESKVESRDTLRVSDSMISSSTGS